MIDLVEFLLEHDVDPSDVGEIGEVSDGCHTFNSLYEQRLVLSAALVNVFKNISWKSYKHDDGELCFGGGWFIVGINTPAGPYTYHYQDKYWELFHCQYVEKAPKWDGHTDKDVGRLLSLNSARIQERFENIKVWED